MVLLGKLAIALGGLVATMVALRLRSLQRIDEKRFDRVILASVAVSRVGLYLALFRVLGFEPASDVASVYYPQGQAALDGQLVYRDFSTSYGPLFPYVVGGILRLWNSAEALVVFAILIELASLPLWLSVSRRLFSEETTRIAAILYVSSPIPLISVALNGHNQIWVAAFLALSLWLRRSDAASGTCLGLSLIVVKALGVVFVPVLWLFSRERKLWAVHFLLPPTVVVVAAAFYKIDVLSGLRVEAIRLSGGNLPFLISGFGLDRDREAVKRMFDVVLMLGLVSTFLLAWIRGATRQRQNVVHLMVVTFMVFFLLSKKSYPGYLVMAFFPICLSVATYRMSLHWTLLFCAFGVAASLETSLYFRWFGEGSSLSGWSPELSGSPVRQAAFMACELVLVGSYVIYAGAAWRCLSAARSPSDVIAHAGSRPRNPVGL